MTIYIVAIDIICVAIVLCAASNVIVIALHACVLAIGFYLGLISQRYSQLLLIKLYTRIASRLRYDVTD